MEEIIRLQRATVCPTILFNRRMDPLERDHSTDERI
jgi:hypothetical protein